MKVGGDQLPDAPLLGGEFLEVRGRQFIDRLNPLLDDVIDGAGIDHALAFGERHARVELGHHHPGVVDRRVQGLDRQPQAELPGERVAAHLEYRHIGLVVPALADQAVQVGQRAGQVIGPAVVGSLAHLGAGEDGVGHHPILEPLLHVGHVALKQQVDHLQERQFRRAGAHGRGDGRNRGRGGGGVRTDVAGDLLLVLEVGGDDLGQLGECNGLRVGAHAISL